MSDLYFDITPIDSLPQTARVVVEGAIDASSVIAFESKLKQLQADGYSNFVLDMSGIKYVNSTGLGSLVSTADNLEKVGGGLVLIKVHPKVKVVFDMLGLNSFFKIFTSEQEAIRHLAGKGGGESAEAADDPGTQSEEITFAPEAAPQIQAPPPPVQRATAPVQAQRPAAPAQPARQPVPAPQPVAAQAATQRPTARVQKPQQGKTGRVTAPLPQAPAVSQRQTANIQQMQQQAYAQPPQQQYMAPSPQMPYPQSGGYSAAPGYGQQPAYPQQGFAQGGGYPVIPQMGYTPAPQVGFVPPSPQNPQVVACPACGSTFKVSQTGRYKCPSCATSFVVDPVFGVEFAPATSQLTLSFTPECREGFALFVNAMVRRAGYADQDFFQLKAALDEVVDRVLQQAYGNQIYEMFAAAFLPARRNLQMKLIANGPTLGGDPRALFPTASRVLSKIDIRPHPKGGSVIVMTYQR